jgi:hypothetical protein
MQGAFFLPWRNRSRTRDAPTPDEHLDEVAARDREERHAGLAGDRAREQRLAGAGRTDQQHALRDPAAEARELLRLAQELDDLLELDLRFLDARDVLERHAVLVLGEQPRARLAEAHRLAAAGLHLADEEDPQPDDQQQREPHDQDLAPEARLGLRPRVDRGDVTRELREQPLGDRGRVAREVLAALSLPLIRFSSMTTDSISPASTFFMNSL